VGWVFRAVNVLTVRLGWVFRAVKVLTVRVGWVFRAVNLLTDRLGWVFRAVRTVRLVWVFRAVNVLTVRVGWVFRAVNTIVIHTLRLGIDEAIFRSVSREIIKIVSYCFHDNIHTLSLSRNDFILGFCISSLIPNTQ